MQKNKPCKIEIEEISDNRPQFPVECLQIRFMNNGQTSVRIDECIFLKPGESFIEGDLNVNSCGIKHQYKIHFYPAASVPDLVANEVFKGDKLFIRKIKRGA